jgi:hypothetical protein
MTGFKSKKIAALDEEGMYLVHQTAQPAQESKDRKRGSIALARSLCYKINGAADESDDMDGGGYGSVDIAEILSAEVVRLQAALAQPAQEPDYWRVYGLQAHTEKPFEGATPLYTTPPKPVQNHSEDNLNMVAQREWVDLTDNQIEQVYYDLVKIHRGAPMPWGQIQFGKVLQAAMREANK